MTYDINIAEPTLIPNTVRVPYSTKDAITGQIILDVTHTGSSFPAISGYILNNLSSMSPALLRFYYREAGILPEFFIISVNPGEYQSFYVVGALSMSVTASNTTPNNQVSGEVNYTINSNPY